jgi:DNA repair ATPase RecN
MRAEINAQPNGARFFRADLHIHSCVGSHDVTDKTCTPQNIVARAKQEGLDMIAIADHNEITAIDAAHAATQQAGLMLVPAVELSTSEGHLLCYLPTVDALKKFHARLTIADSGTPNSRCQEAMLTCLNHLKELGGFALLAHVDGGNGFETNNPGSKPHKKDILCHPALLGMELKSAASVVSYSDLDPDAVRKGLGKDRIAKLKLGPQQYLARVLNSDAHTLQAVGRNASNDHKVTRFKMNGLTFESLCLALHDCDARVRIEEDIPSDVPRVVGTRLSGGFLDGTCVRFSSNLNCIIGGRGAGKSTMFEGIRCLSGYPGEPAPVVDSDVWPDQVDLLVQDESGQDRAISRGKGGDLENADDIMAEPLPFPIECYRQGETHEISQRAQRDPAALLQYLDRFVDVEDDLRDEQELCDALLKLQGEIEKCDEHIERIPKFEQDLKATKGQIGAIEKNNGKEVITIQRTVAQEKNVREIIFAQAKAISDAKTGEDLKTHIAAIKGAVDPATLQVGSIEFGTINTLAATFEKQLQTSGDAIKTQAMKLLTDVQAQLQAWYTKAQNLAQQIEAKKKALEAQGVRVDLAFFQKLANDEARLTKDVNNLKTWVPHRAKLVKERAEVLKARWEMRDCIATKRGAFATKASGALKEALSDLNVSLKFESGAHSPEADEIVIQAMGWKTNQQLRAPAITRDLTVRKLLTAVTKKDTKALTDLKDLQGKTVFTATEAGNVLQRLGEPAIRYQLERCQIVDRPRLTVTRLVSGPGNKKLALTREFSQLSLGQQQSVLLALMLSSNSNVPLIIDQPEDNLDSEFIYYSIVPVLRRAKERRQVIVVTHNPNIAVLGDAEQVIVLKSTATKSSVVASGSIDDDKTRNAACKILEGSQEAFKRRARVYGFELKS